MQCQTSVDNQTLPQILIADIKYADFLSHFGAITFLFAVSVLLLLVLDGFIYYHMFNNDVFGIKLLSSIIKDKDDKIIRISKTEACQNPILT